VSTATLVLAQTYLMVSLLRGRFGGGGQWPKREVDNSSPSRVKVTNARSFTHTHISPIRLHGAVCQNRDNNFTVTSVSSRCTGQHYSRARGDHTAMLSVPYCKKTKSSLLGRRSITALVCVSPAAPSLPPPSAPPPAITSSLIHSQNAVRLSPWNVKSYK
jgi:hypothetical protein